MAKRIQNRIGDAEPIESQDATTIRIIATIIAVTLLTAIGVAVVDLMGGSLQQIILALIAIATFAILSMLLVRRGINLPARLLVPVSIFLLLTYLIRIGGNIHTIALVAYPVVLMIASFTLGKNAPYAFGTLMIIVAVILGWLEMEQLIITPGNAFGRVDEIVLFAILVLATAGLQRIFLGRPDLSLRMAHEDSQAYVQMNQELRELQIILVERVSELRQVDEALRKNEIRYRALFERTNDGIFILGLDSTILAVNVQACRMLGYTEQELVGSSPQKIVVPEERDQAIDKHRALLQEQSLPLYERSYLRKDGTRVQTELNVAMVFDDANKPLHIQSIVRDITERKRNEEILVETNQTLQTLIHAAPLAINVVDLNYAVKIWNPASQRIFGWSAAEVIGKPLPIIPQEIKGSFQAQFQSELAGSSLVDFEAKRLRKDGTLIDTNVWTAPLRDKHGQIIARMGIMADMTEHKQAQQEREKLIAELEMKNAELERFAYTVSHDLKSPLITIRGFLGYLDQDARGGDMHQFDQDLARITAATDKMQRLLIELLELSRIGRLMNPAEDVPFATIAREAVELVRGQLTAKNIPVTIADPMPVVRGDSVRLIEVVQNLIDNAVKFTGTQTQPAIDIGVRGTDAEGKPIFFVQDNGIGIDPSYHERIFGLFNKLDVQSEGTGVGLALVKRIIEVHGGRIWVESEGIGKGSTFCFTLNTEVKA